MTSLCRAAGLLLCVAPTHAQFFSSSVVGTDFDFITESDPSAFKCLEYKGHSRREMPDKSGESALIQRAFIFMAYFADGTSIDFAVDTDFASDRKARTEALRYTEGLGRLPTVLRRGVKRVVIHKGQEDTTAFSDIGLIVLYSGNATKRISTNDLEETIFHESVHAAWDRSHARSPGWLDAQRSDGRFVTDYAKKYPEREDLAESALFAYTLLHHPGRIPATEAAKINGVMPARIAYVANLVPVGMPTHDSVGPKYNCDGTGSTFTLEGPGDE